MKKSIIKAVFFLLFFSSKALFAENNSFYADSSFYYPFRDISDPIIKDKRFERIIVLSGLRVGSTLMFMILQYLFEDTLEDHESFNKKVTKAHGIGNKQLSILQHPNTYVVVPTRNPIDSFCSLVKALQKFTSEEALLLVDSELKLYKELKKTLQQLDNNRVLKFKYEEFNENFLNIFKELEDRFQLKISDDEKAKINTLFSKESVRNYFKEFTEFSERNHILGVHGHHISSDKRTLEDLFPEETVKIIHEKLSPVAAYFGY